MATDFNPSKPTKCRGCGCELDPGDAHMGYSRCAECYSSPRPLDDGPDEDMVRAMRGDDRI